MFETGCIVSEPSRMADSDDTSSLQCTRDWRLSSTARRTVPSVGAGPAWTPPAPLIEPKNAFRHFPRVGTTPHTQYADKFNGEVT